MPCLLKICCTEDYNTGTTSDICQGAVTLLRQYVEERWDTEGEISQNDKEIIKENIVGSMSACTDLMIIENLEDCMNFIALEDYPERWDGVLEQIGANMVSEDLQVCYAALCSLRAIVKKYYMKIGGERKPLLEITENAFSILEGLFQKHLETFDDTSVIIMTVLTKIFYLANYVVLYYSIKHVFIID